jgi:branched-chain amino acid transport system ATP-binding protein
MLAIARALMARPRIVLMDEPSMGLAPRVVTEIYRIIGSLKRMGTTILLVEQNARKALRVADRGYVLETGHLTLEAPAAALAADPRVQRAYLGVHA